MFMFDFHILFLHYLKSSFYKFISFKKKVTEFSIYNFSIINFLINLYKINDYKSKIKSLLSNYKCNIENIDKWLNTYKNYYIYWIGITKKDDIEVAIYYRAN